ISKMAGIGCQVFQHFLTTLHNKDGLTTPSGHWPQKHTRLETTDIDGNGSPCSQGFSAGVPGSYEGNGCPHDAGGSYHRGTAHQEASAALVQSAFTHNDYLL